MNIDKVVAEIRSKGYKVVVIHERASVAAVTTALMEREKGHRLAQPSTKPLADIVETHLAVSPFGGKTTARIMKNDEVIAERVSLCSPLDMFERRIGTSKALGRAISTLEKVTEEKISATKKG